MLILAAALACHSGYSLVDWSGRFPAGLKVVDVVVTISPFYSRVIIYPLENPDEFQQCCSNKTVSVIRLPVGNGKFCIRQSQPGMKWKMQILLKRAMPT